MTDYSYRVRIKEKTTPALQDLAAALGFFATKPGRYLGYPSPAALLDALALAYRADPAAAIRAMQSIGVINVATPPTDATPPE